MKKNLLFCAFALIFSASIPIVCHSDENTPTYRPLLEEGKTWKYNHYEMDPSTGDAWTQKICELRLGTVIQIDDNPYYPVYENWQESMADEKLVAYLREDVEAKRVWAVLPQNYEFFGSPLSSQFTGYWEEQEKGEHLLYDFADWKTAFLPFGSFKDDVDIEAWADGIAPLKVEYGDEESCGYSTGLESAIVEGLGFIPDPNGDFPTYYPTLLSLVEYYSWTNGPALLYEIASNDGEVLYAIDKFKPDADFHPGVDRLEAIATVGSIKVGLKDGAIIVASNSAIGTVEVYTAQGQLAARVEAKANRVSIPAESLSAGIYLVKAQGRTFKLVK